MVLKVASRLLVWHACAPSHTILRNCLSGLPVHHDKQTRQEAVTNMFGTVLFVRTASASRQTNQQPCEITQLIVTKQLKTNGEGGRVAELLGCRLVVCLLQP